MCKYLENAFFFLQGCGKFVKKKVMHWGSEMLLVL
jgi:hypothetical protein